MIGMQLSGKRFAGIGTIGYAKCRSGRFRLSLINRTKQNSRNSAQNSAIDTKSMHMIEMSMTMLNPEIPQEGQQLPEDRSVQLATTKASSP